MLYFSKFLLLSIANIDTKCGATYNANMKVALWFLILIFRGVLHVERR